jgi:hypothetical protein
MMIRVSWEAFRELCGQIGGIHQIHNIDKYSIQYIRDVVNFRIRFKESPKPERHAVIM